MVRTYGIEREQFIVRDGKIVTAIDELLPELHRICDANCLPRDLFGYELFAGQVEDRTEPKESVEEIIQALEVNDAILAEAGELLGLQFLAAEYVSEEDLGELAVNGFSERHQQIWEAIPYERKVAASQVAAIHVHVSVSPEQALRVLRACNRERHIMDGLNKVSDASGGKRLAAYRTMAETDGTPPFFSEVSELLSYIEEHGGERDVWDLVRYKPTTGTVEFRMFGTTASKETIKGCIRAASYQVLATDGFAW